MAKSWLHKDACGQRLEFWPKVGYMKLRVERDLKCGRQLAT